MTFSIKRNFLYNELFDRNDVFRYIVTRLQHNSEKAFRRVMQKICIFNLFSVSIKAVKY